MKIDVTRRNNGGTIIISCNELSSRILFRCIRSMPAKISQSASDLMNDNLKAVIDFRGAVFSLSTPFSDYVIEAECPPPIFDDFVAKLLAYRVRWWQKLW